MYNYVNWSVEEKVMFFGVYMLVSIFRFEYFIKGV